MRVLDDLLQAVRDAAVFNPEVQAAPACILWPDRDRQWEPVMPVLQAELPELLILGDYEPENRRGPAIWLRCVITGCTGVGALPEDRPPIVYLPGVSRQDLRAVESCPDSLKPLAELQYRGVIWSQLNAKDWTILAYLKSDQGGLGLDVAQDGDAKTAMQLALSRLLEEDVDRLKGKRLDKDYFNNLMTGGDPVRDLLQWLDQGDAFRKSRKEGEWKAFVEVCRSLLGFNPQNEGVLAGAAKLADRKGPWRPVWERFCEAPRRYPNIPPQIEKCAPPNDSLLWRMDEELFVGWPQWNDERETVLRQDLHALVNVPAHEARNKILELEKQNAQRRTLVWAEMGRAPLACSLEHLAAIAELTKSNLAAGSSEDLASGFRSFGWKVDDAVMRALSCVDNAACLEAVTAAIRSVYLPWVEESARHLQKIVEESSYPGKNFLSEKPFSADEGDCVLFVDGLRFDAAQRLAGLLENSGCKIVEEAKWVPLPSVTSTGKPAATPVRDKIEGQDGNPDFEPAVAGTGQSLKGGYHLKKLLTEAGWKVLEATENGDGTGQAWCEFGDIDHEGHDKGWKLARNLDGLLAEVRDRVSALLEAGWKRVRIVTDHGWLLMPGGLPKVGLPSVLTEHKWGRCASLKPGAACGARLFPWYWNPNVFFAPADGISCFISGKEYAHGGLSLQECLTLNLTVTSGKTPGRQGSVGFGGVVWKGLMCTVTVRGDFAGLRLDVRTQAGNPSSSLLVAVKPIGEKGTASVFVEDDDLEGRDAAVVLLDMEGSLVTQISTVIGGGKNG